VLEDKRIVVESQHADKSAQRSMRIA